MSRVKVFILMLLFSAVIFYFGGWGIIWGEPGTSVLDANRAAFGISGNIYGLKYVHRFFNSHIISWILFAFALFFVIRAFITLIFGSKN